VMAAATTATRTAYKVEVFAKDAPDAAGENEVLVRVRTTDSGETAQPQRAAVDLVCALDVSGSMQVEATVQGADGKQESDGLSLLDIVKHAVRTVVGSLGPNDRLALVAYSSKARVVTRLTPMDEAGKRKTEKELARLEPDGCTNIIDGLLKSFDLLSEATPLPRAASARSLLRIPVVLLLTDGQPNEGATSIVQHLMMLQAYTRKKFGEASALPAMLSTFGFGYQLDSALLDTLAREGHGSYAFIPDAGFVGTVFVHAVANLLVTAARSVSLQLTPLNGAALVDPHDATLDIGDLHHGQPRDVIVKLRSMPPPGTPFLAAKATLQTARGPVTVSAEGAAIDPAMQGEIAAQRLRIAFVAAIRAAMRAARHSERSAAMAPWMEEARTIARSDPFVAAMLEDCEGQVTQALLREDWYNRWGRHYLPSLSRAHETQQANNFKDPGVQRYGGPFFSAVRDEIDDLFTKLPPPTPSVKRVQADGSVRPVNMAIYNCATGGCFAGQCKVLMADGTQRRADSVRRGDVLAGGAKVVCVVRTTYAKGSAPLIALPGGLLITPWHPVDVLGNGVWSFPHDIAPETLRERACNAVFTFVLDSVHHATVCGVRCVTLAHGAVGDVREHPYFGTHRVLDDLMAAPGWELGLVELAPAQMRRDATTQLVRGIVTSEC